MGVEQIAKAKQRALDLGIKVWMLEAGRRYAVPSGSDAGIAYEIIVQSNEPMDITCSCPAGTHGRMCKHIGAVLARLEVEQEVEQPVAKNATPARSLQEKLVDLYPAMKG